MSWKDASVFSLVLIAMEDALESLTHWSFLATVRRTATSFGRYLTPVCWNTVADIYTRSTGAILCPSLLADWV